MLEGAVAQPALVELAVPSLFNDGLCKCRPHEFDLLIRETNPAGLDGLPSAIECRDQGENGVRSEYAGLYVIAEEVVHFPSLQARMGEVILLLFLGLASVLPFQRRPLRAPRGRAVAIAST